MNEMTKKGRKTELSAAQRNLCGQFSKKASVKRRAKRPCGRSRSKYLVHFLHAGKRKSGIGLSLRSFPLPVSNEVRRRALMHRESRDAERLVPVAHAPIILAP
jgi:hypothetical protein